MRGQLPQFVLSQWPYAQENHEKKNMRETGNQNGIITYKDKLFHRTNKMVTTYNQLGRVGIDLQGMLSM